MAEIVNKYPVGIQTLKKVKKRILSILIKRNISWISQKKEMDYCLSESS